MEGCRGGWERQGGLKRDQVPRQCKKGKAFIAFRLDLENLSFLTMCAENWQGPWGKKEAPGNLH